MMMDMIDVLLIVMDMLVVKGRLDSAGRVEPGCAKAILIQLLVIVAILIVIIVDIKIIAMVFWLIQITP